ncbi:MAG: allantoate amidohydrolase, partial [Nitriliruptoraceae bacterium]
MSELTTDTVRGFDRLWSTLEPIGRDPAGGYRRFAYTDTDLELREWFVAEARARHLDVHEDRAGNLWAWWEATGREATPGEAVVTGSHLDSVPQGGAFDGPLGVVSALLAIDELRARGITPTRPIAVVAFAEEEGSRFGVACLGSRVLTGRLPASQALALRDDEGVALAEALSATGREPRGLGPDRELLGRVGAFVELHVEQGRGLVDAGAPVGVGSMIRPHGRWRFDLYGRADHAGTTRLSDRDDPMLATARLVLAARAAAEAEQDADPGAVATVGRLRIEPNGVNAIPSQVRAWLDARADDEATVRRLVDRVAGEARTEAVEESWTPRVDLDRELGQRVEEVVARGPRTAPVLATGAGHDAGILATAGVPTAMLFVRNPTGVSHAPDEHAERDDC